MTPLRTVPFASEIRLASVRAALLGVVMILTLVSALSSAADETTPVIEMVYSADELLVARPSVEEIRAAAIQLERAPSITDAGIASPNVTYSDPTADLLFKWLNPDDQDLGLTASGNVMRTDFPSQALALPSTFYWQAITFDMNDYDLSAFDLVPNSSASYYNGTSATATDGTSTTIPAYADLTQVKLTANGAYTRWELSSRGALPSLPESYRLGYNNVMKSGSQELVQFIGATDFTGATWRWALRDRGSFFPWWNDNLDVVGVGVDLLSSDDIRFSARVDGLLAAAYSGTAAWPRFEWYLDADNNLNTGDSFTFSYQEGSYSFVYRLDGIEAIASAFYDPTSGQWIGLMRRKDSLNSWATVEVAQPTVVGDSVTLDFSRQEAGVQSTFRWGLVSSFSVSRGGNNYFGRVDVAPNAGMQVITLPTDPDLLLAEKYSPTLRFFTTSDLFPVDIGYMLINSRLCIDSIFKPPSCTTGVTIAQLVENATNGSYLDSLATTPAEAVERWHTRKVGRSPVIYTHVEKDGNRTAIQYHFFYFYNSWGYTQNCNHSGFLACLPFAGNNHEGDWEKIQIDLVGGQPTHVTLSQHEYSSKRNWQDVEKDASGHPIIYVGYGSHANYFKDSYYSGQPGISVNTWIGEKTGAVEQNMSFPLQLMTDDSPAWVGFAGEWGKEGGGPKGPWLGDAWKYPFNWSAGAMADEARHYGWKELFNDVNWKPSQAVKIQVSTNSKEIELYNANNALVMDRNTNNIGPQAEYISNCEAELETILLHKLPSTDPKTYKMVKIISLPACGAPAAKSQEEEPVTVMINWPDANNGEVTLMEFTNVDIPTGGVGILDLSAQSPVIGVDQDNNGTIDSTIPPTSLQTADSDFSPPAAISDLSFVSTGATSELRWTAPADNGAAGRPMAYDVRYAEFPITTTTWEYATTFAQILTPGIPGSQERLILKGILPGNFFFAVRSYDQNYNVAAISNTAQGQVFAREFFPMILDRP